MTANERQRLIERYERGPKLIKEALAKVPAEALMWRPAPGKWSVHEVVCHCADSETTASVRIRFLIGEDNPTMVGLFVKSDADPLCSHHCKTEARP